ncbi:Hypothetical protein HVR_LOCUS1122 [uncultured virus]|nr:Hypothetical protein HVR_LOCUS1122 [uncultured virus]
MADDLMWPTSEHYYQAHKFIFEDASPIHDNIAKKVRLAATPGEAFALAREYSEHIDPYGIMANSCLEK